MATPGTSRGRACATGRPARLRRWRRRRPRPTSTPSRRVHGSHACCSSWLAGRPPGRVLDAGCFDGRFAQLVRAHGPPRHRRRPSTSTTASPTASTSSSRPTSTGHPAAEVGDGLRRGRRRRHPRARRRAAPAARRPARQVRAGRRGAGRRCPTSATGTPAGASPSGASTTTSAARSTAATSVSSPATHRGLIDDCGLRIVERAHRRHAVRHRSADSGTAARGGRARCSTRTDRGR